MNQDTAAPYASIKPSAPISQASYTGNGSYRRQLAALILVFTILRMVLASVVELGNDEAYYWLYSRRLQWNYFDHPPLVALWARLFTFGLDRYELMVRLGGIVGAGLSTLFMYRTGATLHSERAGWYAAVLYNTSFYAGIVAGLLIMPDSPQMVWWTFGMWMFARIITEKGGWKEWLLFGLAAGLCIMSKVHGVFLWGGVGLYVLLHRRKWLVQPQLYAAFAVTVLVASPILLWNLHYDFATYKFHSQRVVVSGWTLNPGSFLEEVFGQVLFNNPVNFALAVFALATARRWLKDGWRRYANLLYTALPLIALLLYLSFFRTVYPHWSGPAYVSLIPLCATFLTKMRGRQGLFPKWLRGSLLATALFMLGWPLLLRNYPGTWGDTDAVRLGEGDVSLDRYGWKKAGQAFAAHYRDGVRSGTITPGTPLVCPTWWGAHVEYYFGQPAGAAMLGLGALQQTHHYLWTNRLRRDSVQLAQAFCIVPSDEYYNPAKTFGGFYRHIVPEYTITLRRGGVAARRFYVYRLSGWKGTLPEPE